ncbi:OLC1v1015618C1 [Oldenlandia corymbosa var. corymbosa]|uniref:OLC1v1015618C1 n=1 Tax=Oldenlandia corymbosa var. corymbosa TaxID=529605 RepID=A0AAV1E5U5_OLDCO|nr:OLC1v1015618C1 [Oldenlandia corymbosa var. corymbosa]
MVSLFPKVKSIEDLNSSAAYLLTSTLADGNPFGGPLVSCANGEIGKISLKHQRQKEREFHLLNGNTVKAPFMTSKNRQFVKTYDGFKVLRIPYKRGMHIHRRFSMYLYLPSANNGVLDLLRKITSKPRFLQHYSPREKVEVGDFLIPKFMVSSRFEVVRITTDRRTVFHSSERINIFQESYIDVKEEGSEAESFNDVSEEKTVETVDPLVISRVHKTKEILDVVADQPFLLLIVEDVSEAILYMGSMLKVNPIEC